MKFLATLLLGGAALGPAAQAQPTTGYIDASLRLTPACAVNDVAGGNGASVDFGTLDFGDTTTRFERQDAVLAGSQGEGIAVRCSTGTAASLQVMVGSNDAHGGPAQHALANVTTGASYIPYDLYLDSARTQVLRNDTAIPIVGDGSSQKIPLYARAFGAPGLTAGVYSDVLTLQLDF